MVTGKLTWSILASWPLTGPDNMKNFQFSIFNFQFLALVFLLLPNIVFAATAVTEIDTRGIEVNALEGTLVLPEGMRIREIQTGNSVILIWLEKPRQTGNAITFAGIKPGGFTGKQPVFSINGDFAAQDLDGVRFTSVSALKNDGSGASVPARMSLSLASFRADSELPEEFTPTIASDPNVFDGKFFLVFATQDKSSGVDRYEVREGRWGFFREAESPYLLKHQGLNRDVYVKATDNAGNERVAVLAARVHRAWWERDGLLAILMVIAVVTLAYKKAWIRFTK